MVTIIVLTLNVLKTYLNKLFTVFSSPLTPNRQKRKQVLLVLSKLQIKLFYYEHITFNFFSGLYSSTKG